jgi:hypothetical protein
MGSSGGGYQKVIDIRAESAPTVKRDVDAYGWYTEGSD